MRKGEEEKQEAEEEGAGDDEDGDDEPIFASAHSHVVELVSREIARRAGFEEMAAEASHAVERLAVVRVDDECQKACLRIELLESKHDNLVVALFVTAEIVTAVQDSLVL